MRSSKGISLCGFCCIYVIIVGASWGPLQNGESCFGMYPGSVNAVYMSNVMHISRPNKENKPIMYPLLIELIDNRKNRTSGIIMTSSVMYKRL